MLPGIGSGESTEPYPGLLVRCPFLSVRHSFFVFRFSLFSGYFVRRIDEMHQSWIGFFKPFAVLFVLAVLLLAEPDFGATVVISLSALTLMFLAGAPLLRFCLLLFVVLVSAAALAATESYRLARLLAFVNPWDEKFVYGSG